MEFLPMITSLTSQVTEEELQSDFEVLCNIADVNVQAIHSMDVYINNINQGMCDSEAFHMVATNLQKDTQW